jgi:hypothetical protein
MQRRMSVGILTLSLLIGCTHVAPYPPAQPGAQAVNQAAPPASSPEPAPVSQPPSSNAPMTASPNTAEPPVPALTAAPVPPKKPMASATNPKTAPVPASASAAAAAQTAATHTDKAPAARAQTAAAPALDLAALEQRLKDTRAIGVFSKLSLKNQVDDLLNEFRAFYGGQARTSLAELRQRYDLLLLKVLSLLQDGDPPLASAISTSREAIWGVLADRDKFQKALST